MSHDIDIAQVGRLARIALTPAEVDALHDQLQAILGYVEQLETLDVDGVEPTSHAVPLSTPFRADVPRPELSRDAALANAPETDGKSFAVPKVV